MMEFEYSPGSITEFRDSFPTRANWQTWEEQDPYPRKLTGRIYSPSLLSPAHLSTSPEKLPESFSPELLEEEEEEWVFRFFEWEEISLQLEAEAQSII